MACQDSDVVCYTIEINGNLHLGMLNAGVVDWLLFLSHLHCQLTDGPSEVLGGDGVLLVKTYWGVYPKFQV